MGGLGVIPVALIMTLLRRDWPKFGGLAVMGIVVLVLRFFGAWIVDRAEQRELELGAATVAAKQRAITRFRQLAYGALPALFGGLALTMGWLAFSFWIGGVGEAMDPKGPSDPALSIILSFLMAAAFGIMTVVCGYLAIKCVKAGTRK
jgi:NhaP-type Na+/H+ or K+/H+ antiporter